MDHPIAREKETAQIMKPNQTLLRTGLLSLVGHAPVTWPAAELCRSAAGLGPTMRGKRKRTQLTQLVLAYAVATLGLFVLRDKERGRS